MNDKEIHKDNWLSKIIKHGKWYILASIISKGINIIVLRVYTEYLTPSDYGILDTLNAIALLLPFLFLYILTLHLVDSFTIINMTRKN